MKRNMPGTIVTGFPDYETIFRRREPVELKITARGRTVAQVRKEVQEHLDALERNPFTTHRSTSQANGLSCELMVMHTRPRREAVEEEKK